MTAAMTVIYLVEKRVAMKVVKMVASRALWKADYLVAWKDMKRVALKGLQSVDSKVEQRAWRKAVMSVESTAA